MLGDDRGGRRLVPPQSIFGHAIRDRLHLVRSEALELAGGFAAGDVAPLGLRYRLDGLLRASSGATCCICSRPVMAHRDRSLRSTNSVAIGGIADVPPPIRMSWLNPQRCLARGLR